MKKGFTLIELLVVISIISLLSSIVYSSLDSARLSGRNAVYVAEKNQAILALQQYYFKEGEYPESGTWRCLGWSSSERCWVTSYSGLDSLQTALEPYLPNKITPNIGTNGQALLYESSISGARGGPAGAYLIWAVEGSNMKTSDCNTSIVNISGDHYCYQWLGSN